MDLITVILQPKSSTLAATVLVDIIVEKLRTLMDYFGSLAQYCVSCSARYFQSGYAPQRSVSFLSPLSTFKSVFQLPARGSISREYVALRIEKSLNEFRTVFASIEQYVIVVLMSDCELYYRDSLLQAKFD